METYVVLTRLPGNSCLASADAAWLLRERFVPPLLVGAEMSRRIAELLSELGIAGGAVYDALVALAAVGTDADLATRDRRAKAIYDAVGRPSRHRPQTGDSLPDHAGKRASHQLRRAATGRSALIDPDWPGDGSTKRDSRDALSRNDRDPSTEIKTRKDIRRSAHAAYGAQTWPLTRTFAVEVTGLEPATSTLRRSAPTVSDQGRSANPQVNAGEFVRHRACSDPEGHPLSPIESC